MTGNWIKFFILKEYLGIEYTCEHSLVNRKVMSMELSPDPMTRTRFPVIKELKG